MVFVRCVCLVFVSVYPSKAKAVRWYLILLINDRRAPDWPQRHQKHYPDGANGRQGAEHNVAGLQVDVRLALELYEHEQVAEEQAGSKIRRVKLSWSPEWSNFLGESPIPIIANGYGWSHREDRVYKLFALIRSASYAAIRSEHLYFYRTFLKHTYCLDRRRCCT